MKTIDGTKVTVRDGDITELDVDAIVNAANSHLWMGAGVAGAIRRKGGIGIEKEAVGKGPISVGEATVTGSGDLRARHVIHAAVMGPDLVTDGDKIEKATRSALERARELGARTVAFPALGTGVGGFSMGECAEIMVGSVYDYLKEYPQSFTEICFALLGKSAAQTFEKVIHERGN